MPCEASPHITGHGLRPPASDFMPSAMYIAGRHSLLPSVAGPTVLEVFFKVEANLRIGREGVLIADLPQSYPRSRAEATLVMTDTWPLAPSQVWCYSTPVVGTPSLLAGILALLAGRGILLAGRGILLVSRWPTTTNHGRQATSALSSSVLVRFSTKFLETPCKQSLSRANLKVLRGEKPNACMFNFFKQS
ncbi:hypothetical protein HYC85_029213 [Camellia sinensis]|uniref:Uncharacterized protein n=1 Tax=Camellia sinensis TaxID=4442 RepID=A0A7J7FXF7_CAMSI|nr:hypothetical protein HYC85_029213 [Camellia sinensis]